MNKIFEFRNLKKLLENYGPELSCIVSLLSIGMAGYSAFKASSKVAEAKADYEERKAQEDKHYEEVIVTNWKLVSGDFSDRDEITDEMREKFMKTCPNQVKEHERKVRQMKIEYATECALAEKWTIAFGTLAIVSEIGAMKFSADKLLVAAGGLGLSKDKLKKFMNKTKEAIGEEEFEKIKSEIRADNIKEAVSGGETEKSDAPWKDENGTVYEKYYDEFTGSIYEIPESQLNDGIKIGCEYFGTHQNRGGMDFNKWRSMLGLPDCPAGKLFIFNKEHPFEVRITTAKLEDGLWYKVIEYPTMPDELKA